MGLVLTVTAGLVLWIVPWALGMAGFDGFIFATAIILAGATAQGARRLPARPPQLSGQCAPAGSDDRGPAALGGGARRVRRVALGVAGCGGVGVSGASSTIGNQLTIYSSLPLQGPSGPTPSRSSMARSSR